jgi:hypothetical protein
MLSKTGIGEQTGDESYEADLEIIGNLFSQDSKNLQLPENLKGSSLINKVQSKSKLVAIFGSPTGRRWVELTAYAACFALMLFGINRMILGANKTILSKQAENQSVAQTANDVGESASALTNSQVFETISAAGRTLESGFGEGSSAANNPLFIVESSGEIDIIPNQPAAKTYDEVIDVIAKQIEAAKSRASRNAGFTAPRLASTPKSYSIERQVHMSIEDSFADYFITDGDYLYWYNSGGADKNSQISIIDAADLAVISQFGLNERSNVRMHIEANNLIVLSEMNKNDVVEMEKSALDNENYISGGSKNDINTDLTSRTVEPARQLVVVRIYDVSDKSNPILKKQAVQEGTLIFSQAGENKVYLATNKRLTPSQFSLDMENNLLPLAAEDETAAVLKPEEILIVGQSELLEPGYVILSAVDLTTTQVKKKCVVGSGKFVVAAQNSIYIISEYTDMQAEGSGGLATSIFKFDTYGNNLEFAAEAHVKGQINDISQIVESDESLRIASSWFDEDNNRVWCITVFNNYLERQNEIETVAQNRKISSAVLVGRYGYLTSDDKITYAADFTSSGAIELTGPIQIEEISGKLLPIDNIMAVEIGYHYIEGPDKESSNDGIKLSLYDTSQPMDPKLVDRVLLGNAGSKTAAAGDSSLTVLDSERKRIVFQATVYTEYDSANQRATHAGAVLSFDGHIVVGFGPKITIEKEIPKALDITGYYRSDTNRAIEKLLRAGETFFIASQKGIAAYDLETLTKINELAP